MALAFAQAADLEPTAYPVKTVDPSELRSAFWELPLREQDSAVLASAQAADLEPAAYPVKTVDPSELRSASVELPLREQDSAALAFAQAADRSERLPRLERAA